jgi:hypothetical protein
VSCPECHRLRDLLHESERNAADAVNGLVAKLEARDNKIAEMEDEAEGYKCQARQHAGAITRAKNELRAFLEDEQHHDFDDARRVFEHWKRVHGKDPKRVIWDADGERAKLIRTALRWKFQDGTKVTWQQLCDAISGHGLKPYSGPRGWQATEYPRSKHRDEIHHAIGDAAKLEKWLEVWRNAQAAADEMSWHERDRLYQLWQQKSAETDHLLGLLLGSTVRAEAEEHGEVPDNVIELRKKVA